MILQSEIIFTSAGKNEIWRTRNDFNRTLFNVETLCPTLSRRTFKADNSIDFHVVYSSIVTIHNWVTSYEHSVVEYHVLRRLLESIEADIHNYRGGIRNYDYKVESDSAYCLHLPFGLTVFIEYLGDYQDLLLGHPNITSVLRAESRLFFKST